MPSEILVLRFTEPVAIIGDIHGCADLLERLLGQLGPLPILVVGDVGDRGPDTRRVIDLLITREAQGVLGNHDDWLLNLAQHRGFDSFVLNQSMGGEATLRSYGITGHSPREVEAQSWKIPPAHRTWLESLALVIDLEVAGERYWLSHSGIPSHPDLAALPDDQVVPMLMQLPPAVLFWSATGPNTMRRADRPVIMGHIPRTAPLDAGWLLAIDTGAGGHGGHGGKLTAVVLPERRFVVVQ